LLRPEPSLRFLLHRRRGGAGTRPARKITSGTGRGTRKAISRSRPPITTRTSAPKWSTP
jgi:hypothetical protein